MKVLLVLALLVFKPPSHAVDDLHEINVWARVLFGPYGVIQEFEFVNEKAQPAAFLERVRSAVSNARIAPPTVDGIPTTFKTGLRIGIVLNRSPQNLNFRISFIRPSPIPLVQGFRINGFRYLMAMKEWGDSLVVSCTVQINGTCKDVTFEDPGAVEEAKSYARYSVKSWRFEPQELGGKPIEAEYKVVWNIRAVDVQK